MVRRTLGWTVLVIGLGIAALVAFSQRGPLDVKFWAFTALGTIAAAAALIATVWVQPNEVFDGSDKVIVTLLVLIASAGVLLLLLFIGLGSFSIDGGM